MPETGLSTSPSQAPKGYQVLARKYRSQRLSDLVGQEVLVTALGNGIESGRLPHAFLFTGVRGVGKTSTARILARSLNCVGPDGQGQETINPCGVCDPCQAIAEDRHMDVIEMDAASRTSVEDVREIIEAARYKPVSARYKIYIVDEVHMLSKSAFNALLKTLEEPPAHVKFIFATTEIHKVPVTILSRCMRFDLRRLRLDELMGLMSDILGKEELSFEEKILSPLAAAAEGSARDALSLLERAIALSGKKITEKVVQEMLGLAAGDEVEQLFTALNSGETVTLLNLYEDLYQRGRAPQAILKMLLDHVSVRIKKQALGEESSFSMPILHRVWQGLLKGLSDIERAPLDFQAGEVVLLRLSHLSQMPDLETLIHQRRSEPKAPAVSSLPTPSSAPSASERTSNLEALAPAPAVAPKPLSEVKPPNALPQSFEELVTFVQNQKEPLLAAQLKQDIHVVSYTPENLVARLGEKATQDLWSRFQSIVRKGFPGTSWVLETVSEGGAPTLIEKEDKIREDKRTEALNQPLVKKALDTFPDAEVKQVNGL
ncbi:MAG: DNA polymerase III subunit gamma/tau [bacterium]|nr:DNA polymerase III subunit gamma/tau [bacterium]